MAEDVPASAIGGRYYRIRKDVLRSLRVQKGWRVEDLARKAICSPKTVENCERGKPVLLVTLSKIAKALGVENRELIDDGDRPEVKSPPPGPFIELTMKLVVPFESFDETSDLFALLQALSRKMGTLQGDVLVKNVRDGSVAIDLQLSDERDVRTLVRLYCSLILQDLRVQEVVVPGYEGIVSDVAAGLIKLADARDMGQRRAILGLHDRFSKERDAAVDVRIGNRARGFARFRIAHTVASDLWRISSTQAVTSKSSADRT